MAVNLRPPQGVRSAAKRGIELVAQGKAGDGFMPATLQRARKIAAGEELTPAHVKRMYSFFRRHSVDRRPGWGDAGKETPGYVAWMAWGGDPGASWSAKVVRQLENLEEVDEPQAQVLGVLDQVFEVEMLNRDAEPLSALLDDLSERYGVDDDESVSSMLARARAVVQSLADELAADGEDTEALDRMSQQLTAMAREMLADDARREREHEAAAATYDDDGGMAEDEREEDDVLDLTYDMGEDEPEEGPWTPRQLALYEVLEQVVEEHGPFDRSIGPDGLHYMSAEDNPFARQGMACSNCIFFEGGNRCELLPATEEVEPSAVCKYWIIPGEREGAVEEDRAGDDEDRAY